MRIFKTLLLSISYTLYNWVMETIAGIARHRMHAGAGKWPGNEGIQAGSILIGSVSSRGNRGQISYVSAKSALHGVCSTLNTKHRSIIS